MQSSLIPPFSLVAQLLLGIGLWIALVCFGEMVRTAIQVVRRPVEKDDLNRLR